MLPNVNCVDFTATFPYGGAFIFCLTTTDGFGTIKGDANGLVGLITKFPGIPFFARRDFGGYSYTVPYF